VVIHPNKVRVRIKSDRRWSHLKRRLALESQTGGVPNGGAQETSDERLNATINLEGGKCSRKKVSPKHSLVFDFVLQFSDRILVPLGSLASKNVRFFFQAPMGRPLDRLYQVFGGIGKVALHEDDFGKDLEQKLVSHNLLSCV
jgi:hypothetical protein